MSEELDHFSYMLAALIAAAVRARDPERLDDVRCQLEETLGDAFALIIHDATKEANGNGRT